jgi:hypothetical protein
VDFTCEQTTIKKQENSLFPSFISLQVFLIGWLSICLLGCIQNGSVVVAKKEYLLDITKRSRLTYFLFVLLPIVQVNNSRTSAMMTASVVMGRSGKLERTKEGFATVGGKVSVPC